MGAKTIWMSPPLEKLADACGRGNTGRGGQFSRRLGDIVERYAALMSCASLPDLSDDDRMIISAAVSGSIVTPTMLRHLPDMLRDLGIAGAVALADSVEGWDVLTRAAVIEEAYPK